MTEEPPQRSVETLQSVTRALSLLDVLGRYDEGATAKALSVDLGISLGAIYHQLVTLRAAGYVIQDPLSQLFLLGPRVPQLHQAYLESLTPVGSVTPLLQSLQEATGETVHLGRLRGEQVVLIGIAPGTRRNAVPGGFLGLGGPAHSVALGRAILAALPELELERFLHVADLSAQGPFAASDPAWLRRELCRIRETGYALDPGDRSTRTGGCLAVALPQTNRQTPDALSVVAPRARFLREVQDWIPRVSAVAQALVALESATSVQAPTAENADDAGVADAMEEVVNHGARKARTKRAGLRPR
jgi:IclR family acetate operon transcriptional repressor